MNWSFPASLYEWAGHAYFEEGAYESFSYKKVVNIDDVPRTLYLYSHRHYWYIALAPLGEEFVTDGMQVLYKLKEPVTMHRVNLMNVSAALNGDTIVFEESTGGEGEKPYPTVDFTPLQNKACG